ncbi:MAG: Gfo/Idh/MocA family oxidoreductase [Bryobacterales bacterium]|nr:Gfo/Idh/MocA family oxidoreductase [Bryobacterales bacterium]
MKPKRREFFFTLGAAPLAAGAAQTAPAAKRIGVGLIGAGGRGSWLGQVPRQLQEQGANVELIGVCDLYQPRRERAAAKLGAKEYKTTRELLSNPEVEAVIIASPDRMHVYNALEAVRAGKDVYCEKPLTHWTQFDKLKELVREVRARKTIFQVGAQLIADPQWDRGEELIRKGTIGKVVHAQTGYFRHSDAGERMPIDDPNARPGPDLDWEAWQGDAPRKPFTVSRFFQWRMYMDYAGGPITDLHVHPFTRVAKLLNLGFPKKAAAFGGKFYYNGEREVPDTADVILEYEGLTVSALGTVVNDTGGMATVIRGSEGTVTFSGKEGQGLSFEPQPGSKGRAFEVGTLNYDLAHQRDFYEAVRTRRQPRGNLELGYRVQVAMIMAMQSLVSGKVAHFDAASETIHLG